MVHDVFRTEDQIAQLQTVLQDRIGRDVLTGSIGYRNAAPRQYQWREMYTPDTRAMVEDLYADDFARWGYSFDLD